MTREATRNATLHWAACRLGERVRAEQTTTREAKTALLTAARHTGLGELEARATIRGRLGRTA
jgi:hypothetical protein